jgi:hypothetical protein
MYKLSIQYGRHDGRTIRQASAAAMHEYELRGTLFTCEYEFKYAQS